MTDDKIVELYFDRNEQAITYTKSKYEKYLYTIAYNILNIREDSEESVNDTYVSAWNTMPPQKPTVLKTYLSKLTRNISLKRFRHNNAQKRGGGETSLALDELTYIASSEDVEDIFDSNELLKLIHSFLQNLKDEQRQIFLARYFYVYSIKDISRKLGYTQSKVKMSLKRTRDTLYNKLKEEGLV